MASKVVWVVAGVICLVVGKFGAALAMVPEPVVGGLLIIGMGMVRVFINIYYIINCYKCTFNA